MTEDDLREIRAQLHVEEPNPEESLKSRKKDLKAGWKSQKETGQTTLSFRRWKAAHHAPGFHDGSRHESNVQPEVEAKPTAEKVAAKPGKAKGETKRSPESSTANSSSIKEQHAKRRL